MIVKFKNGAEKACTAPMEQKVFSGGVPCGWLAAFSLVGAVTSAEMDALLTEENIGKMVFVTDDGKEITLDGYNKVSSAVIRHAVDPANTKVELQLMKTVKEEA